MQSKNALEDMKGLKREKSFELYEYKERNLKKKLTISDINIISRFADNSTTLKQIDEELEERSSSNSDDKEFEIVELDPNQPESVDSLSSGNKSMASEISHTVGDQKIKKISSNKFQHSPNSNESLGTPMEL